MFLSVSVMGQVTCDLNSLVDENCTKQVWFILETDHPSRQIICLGQRMVAPLIIICI